MKRRPHAAEDRGSIAAFVVVITTVFIACAGLVVDGARIVAAKSTAADHAGNAARAGAQEIVALRDGLYALDSVRARDAAVAALAAVGATGSVTVTPTSITVSVYVDVPMTLLRLTGVASKRVTATRTAVPATGQDGN